MVDADVTLTPEGAIANLTQTEDPSLRYYAAWWLGRFRVNRPEAVEALVGALEDDSVRDPDGSYPLRRNAARALGKLSDTRVVPALVNCLSCADYYVREAAVQALGALGDSRCVSDLIGLLAGGLEAAVAVPGKPHLVQPYNALLEALGMLAGAEASEVVAAVKPFLNHDRPQVQNAAARAMYQLTGDAAYCDLLLSRLQADNLQLRRSALMDLGAVGFLPAAEAIAQTPAENSLKLIALQGVLETHLRQASEADPSAAALTAAARKVMDLMDSLL
ncbi:phycocyanobilin lyase [filamentous cyanobacterium CCP5]|nr:phycocyanobilin lyase [filamentous cyanobacterium CCT1]PSN18347.1 phycocyanobilin lyase [filamentous cyanobacterium CCP5]